MKHKPNTITSFRRLICRLGAAEMGLSELNGSYYITHITDEAVQRYNTVIRENADEFVIINR